MALSAELRPLLAAVLLLCAAAGSAEALCQAVPQTGATFRSNNVIYNPGFEQSTVNTQDSWGALPFAAPIASKSDPAISNSNFGVAYNRTLGEGPSQVVRAYIGDGFNVWRFQAWVRLGRKTAGTAPVSASYMIITPMDMPQMGDAVGPVQASTECWTLLSADLVIPYSSASTFFLYFKGPDTSFDVYVDNVALYRKPTAADEDLPLLRG